MAGEIAPKKVPVTVYAESTRNPSVMKFVANKMLVENTFEYKSEAEAVHAPLAQALFGFPLFKKYFWMRTTSRSIKMRPLAGKKS